MRRLPALFLAVCLLAAPAHAQMLTAEAAPSRTIAVPKDKSAAFRLNGAAGEIVVAQPDIAQIVATTDRSIYIRGKALGSTNILVYDRSKQLIEVIDVKVGFDTPSLEADLAAALPGETIRATGLADGILLSGDVSTSSAANRARTIALRYAPNAVSSTMNVRAAEQVMLEVRIIEAGRTALKDFGINLDIQNASGLTLNTGTGLIGNNPAGGVLAIGTNIGTASIDVTLQALEEKGIIRTLARPNLAAISGEEATFLAGGEFPYPIPSADGTISIEFKQFGVALKFTPVVEDSGLIRLKVAPEVSQLDSRQSLRLGGFEIPALLVRRAATTVELRDGQSFAMAGLFQQDYVNTVRQVPGLSEVPVLGALFRSARWRREETELVIIVTPRMASPAQSLALAPQPLSAPREPTTIDMLLDGAVFERPLAQSSGAQSNSAEAPSS